LSSQLHAQIFQQNKKQDSLVVSDEGFFPSPDLVLDQVTVTAHKSPVKQSKTAKVTTVINKAMLEKMGSRSVGEILNTVAGVTINGANNTLGTNQRISIRGSSDGNVLLLMDGIPVNDPSVISNYFDLNFINTSEIERIEIVKGGQSTLYGSDAVNGVINIITKKPANKKFSGYGGLSGGSYGTINGNIGVNGYTNNLTYQTYVSAITSSGFSSAYDEMRTGDFDKDGYKQIIARADIGLKLTHDLTWNFLAGYSDYKADIDYAAFTDDNDFYTKNKNLQLGSGFRWKKQNSELKINYQFNHVNRLYLDDSTDHGPSLIYSESRYIGRTHFAEAYESYKWDKFGLLGGIDYRFYNTEQTYHATTSFGPFDSELDDSLAKMWIVSPYAAIFYNGRVADIELAGRYNHHNVYGNNFTYSFNPSVRISHQLKLFGNLSTAFKTPSLYQLFDPYIGNKNLEPEKSMNLELGTELTSKEMMKFRLTGFYHKTKNAIQFIITDPVYFLGRYENVSAQKNYGVEFEFNLVKNKWSISSNYTYTQGKITSGYTETGNTLSKDTTYKNLYRVPDHAANIILGYKFNNKLELSTLLKYVGKRFEPVYGSAPKQLDDYYTIDLSAQYRINSTVRASIDLKNITNQRYFDVLGYNSKRFNLAAGVAFNF
jgi:vitamin B12 transporter